MPYTTRFGRTSTPPHRYQPVDFRPQSTSTTGRKRKATHPPTASAPPSAKKPNAGKLEIQTTPSPLTERTTESADVPQALILEKLPLETLFKLFTFLDYLTLRYCVGATCHRWREVVLSNEFERDFGSRNPFLLLEQGLFPPAFRCLSQLADIIPSWETPLSRIQDQCNTLIDTLISPLGEKHQQCIPNLKAILTGHLENATSGLHHLSKHLPQITCTILSANETDQLTVKVKVGVILTIFDFFLNFVADPGATLYPSPKDVTAVMKTLLLEQNETFTRAIVIQPQRFLNLLAAALEKNPENIDAIIVLAITTHYKISPNGNENAARDIIDSWHTRLPVGARLPHSLKHEIQNIESEGVRMILSHILANILPSAPTPPPSPTLPYDFDGAVTSLDSDLF